VTLNDHEVGAVRTAVTLWADRHPKPDYPILAIGYGVELSPREIADAVNQSDTDDTGRKLLEVIDAARERVPLEEIIADFQGVLDG